MLPVSAYFQRVRRQPVQTANDHHGWIAHLSLTATYLLVNTLGRSYLKNVSYVCGWRHNYKFFTNINVYLGL